MRARTIAALLVLFVSILVMQVACGGGSSGGSAICNCQPSEPASVDFRHDQKHIPLPGSTPLEISVATILKWPQSPTPAPNAPRSGRELQMFHIANGFLQLAWVNPGDCDIHMEISDSPAKSAPRVIVETPIDPEYCSSRQHIESQLKAHGFTLGNTLPGGELPQAIPAEVLGLAFQDFKHKRGSQFVSTVWELHPANVNLLQ